MFNLDPEEEKLFILNQEMILHTAEEEMIDKKFKKLQEEMDLLRHRSREIQVRKVAVRTKISDVNRTITKMKDAEVLRKLNETEDEWMKGIIEEIVELTNDFPSIKRARHYQYDDIIATYAAYLNNKNGMLNANDMGAGKTAETVMSLYIFTKKFMKDNNGKVPSILWLTKKSLVKTTPTEIKRWWPSCKIFVSKEISTLSEREFSLEMYDMIGGIFMANYEFVRSTPKINDRNWDFVVIDEVHKLKGGANSNGPTVVWETCKSIAVKARFNMMLTGTPMVNKPEEMWSYLHILAPDRFPDMKKFKRDFCEYKDVAGVMELCVDPTKILETALKGQMIRRSRAEFGIELPELDLQNEVLVMGTAQRDVYLQMRDRFFVWLDSQNDSALTATAIIAQLTRLRQINLFPAGIAVEHAVVDDTGAPIYFDNEIMTVKKALSCRESIKIDEAMDRIEMVTSLPSQVNDSISEQLVLFCTFNEPMREIQRRCDELKISCEIISGQTTSRERNRNLEDEFQRGKIQVLCINSAMGEGLNLQKNPSEWIGGASYGIMLDKWWSPARNEQCIGRIHRQGGTYPVTFWIFENESSVDQYIDAILNIKIESFKSIMDSEKIRPKSDWKEYLKGLL